MMLLVLSLFVGTLVTAQRTPPPLNCNQQPNGVYRWGCKSYEACNNGQAEFVECLGDEAYDQNSQRCVNIQQAAPPCNIIRDCSDAAGRLGVKRYVEKDGIGQYPCQFYYTCAFGRFLGHHMCAPGTVYDEENQQCTWPRRVAQPCGDLLPGQNPDGIPGYPNSNQNFGPYPNQGGFNQGNQGGFGQGNPGFGAVPPDNGNAGFVPGGFSPF